MALEGKRQYRQQWDVKRRFERQLCAQLVWATERLLDGHWWDYECFQGSLLLWEGLGDSDGRDRFLTLSSFNIPVIFPSYFSYFPPNNFTILYNLPNRNKSMFFGEAEWASGGGRKSGASGWIKLVSWGGQRGWWYKSSFQTFLNGSTGPKLLFY